MHHNDAETSNLLPLLGPILLRPFSLTTIDNIDVQKSVINVFTLCMLLSQDEGGIYVCASFLHST